MDPVVKVCAGFCLSASPSPFSSDLCEQKSWRRPRKTCGRRRPWIPPDPPPGGMQPMSFQLSCPYGGEINRLRFGIFKLFSKLVFMQFLNLNLNQSIPLQMETLSTKWYIGWHQDLCFMSCNRRKENCAHIRGSRMSGILAFTEGSSANVASLHQRSGILPMFNNCLALAFLFSFYFNCWKSSIGGNTQIKTTSWTLGGFPFPCHSLGGPPSVIALSLENLLLELTEASLSWEIIRYRGSESELEPW